MERVELLTVCAYSLCLCFCLLCVLFPRLLVWRPLGHWAPPAVGNFSIRRKRPERKHARLDYQTMTAMTTSE